MDIQHGYLKITEELRNKIFKRIHVFASVKQKTTIDVCMEFNIFDDDIHTILFDEEKMSVELNNKIQNLFSVTESMALSYDETAMVDRPSMYAYFNPERVHYKNSPSKPVIQFKKLEHADYRILLPKYQTEGAAGFDLQAGCDISLMPGARALIPTGLSVAIPNGYELQIRPRSGLAAKHGIMIVNTPGTVDSDYRGELKIILLNTDKYETFLVNYGDRIAQAVLTPVVQADMLFVEELSSTERGMSGFGSTGI